MFATVLARSLIIDGVINVMQTGNRSATMKPRPEKGEAALFQIFINDDWVEQNQANCKEQIDLDITLICRVAAIISEEENSKQDERNITTLEAIISKAP